MSENNINLDQVIQDAQPIKPAAPQQEAAPQAPQQGVVIQTPQEQAPVRPQLPPDDAYVIGEQPQSGIVVNTEQVMKEPEHNVPIPGDLNPDLLEAVGDYMKEMEGDIAELKQIKEEIIETNPEAAKEAAKEEARKNGEDFEDDEDEEEAEVDPEEAAADLDKRFDEAIVVIDKLGMGSVQFTDEEREKLERVKKIKLHEVETVDISTFKTKKAGKKKSVDKVLKVRSDAHTTPIILPASGYTARMLGCSTYELISLMNQTDDAAADTQSKWSLIYDKLDQPSIGKLGFNDFLRATASQDYNVFIYGILCSTYPDDDTLPLKCTNKDCEKEFEHKYSVRSLIRAEAMSDKLQEAVATIVDGSHTEETAKAAHDAAPVNQVKYIRLPISDIVVELHVQSAYDLMNKTIKDLSKDLDEKYDQASILSTLVRAAYVQDPESDDPNDRIEYDKALDITKIIYSLQDTDLLTLTNQSEEILNEIGFSFGLMNVKCPHCGEYHETVPFDIESILFYRYQQAMSTKVE